MLRPQRMCKIEVLGSREYLDQVIDTFYRLQFLHVQDFSGEGQQELKRGKPLPQSPQISDKLNTLHRIDTALGGKGSAPKKRYSIAEVEESLNRRILPSEKKIIGLVEEKRSLEEEKKRVVGRKKVLEELDRLPLSLDDYGGYKSLVSFVGHVKTDIKGDVARVCKDFEVYETRAERGHLVALFVPLEKKGEISTLLGEKDFIPLEVPKGKGKVQDSIRKSEKERASLDAKLKKVSEKLSASKEQLGPEIMAVEEYLSQELEKAQAPLRCATTEYAFIIEGWVPKKKWSSAESVFKKKFGDHLAISVIDLDPLTPPPHHDHGKEGSADESAKKVEDPLDKTPILFDNPKTSRPFELLIGLYTLPKYREIDPSTILLLTFPLMFGLMMGDFGFGFLVVVFAMILWKKPMFGIGGPNVAKVLIWCGIFTMIFGLFFFGEAFGMHFGQMYHHGEPDHLTWAYKLDIDVEQPIMLGPIPLGVFSKLHDIKPLLVIAVLMAVLHLNLGFIIGYWNAHYKHGAFKAFCEKGCWLFIELGLLFAITPMIGVDWGFPATDLVLPQLAEVLADNIVLVGVGGIAFGAVLLTIGEGPIGLVELPSIFSNVLSYSRLVAVGLSKAGMVLAFNTMAFELCFPKGGAFYLLGGLAIVGGYILILLLGIMASGLHSLRLQYVEFFRKFYEGGGRLYAPFGKKSTYLEV